MTEISDELLEETGPLRALDAAAALMQQAGVAVYLRGLVASAPLWGAALVVFFFEQVEPIPALRPLSAALLVFAWALRLVLLGRVGRRYALEAWPGLPLPAQCGSALSVLSMHVLGTLGLALWLFPLAVVSWFGAAAVAVAIPLLALRPVLAPSALVSAACSDRGGVAGFSQMLRDGTDRRFTAVIAELFLLLGTELLAVNLYFGVGLILLAARSLLGVDPTFVEAFVSLRNPFMVALVALVSAWLMDPLRAALSAVHFLDVRVRQPGLDLLEAVDSFAKQQKSKLVLGLFVLCLGASVSRPLQAQTAPEPTADLGAAAFDAADQKTAERVEQILSLSLFSNEPDRKNWALTRWFDAFVEWLRALELWDVPEFDNRPAEKPFVPPANWLVAFVLVLVVPVLLWALIAWRKSREGDQGTPDSQDTAGADPLTKTPDAHLDEAALLARSGRHADALRSLYLATLVAFDRHQWVLFDRSRTNGQTVALLPKGPVQEAFGLFTARFDACWYGRVEVAEHDYDRCRVLAEQIARQVETGRGP